MSVKREKAKQAINNESGESREKRLSQKREKTKQEFNNNKTAEHKQTYNRTLEETIDKFHCAVFKGPLFICTCCDQFWYKHSVCCAEKTRLTNPT